tara:strand:- start:5554 stop:6012 length:459 start_codon:yes stop_codon:yes gene_type:complete
MEILRIKLQKDLLQKCQEYKTEQSITDESYDEFVESRINELITDVDLTAKIEINECKCMARMWNNGNGDKQCTHTKKEDDYCGKHHRMLKYDGILRFGDIREEKPKYDLIKKKEGKIEELHWLPSDPIQQLQIVLNHQARKVILATPHLLVD